MKRLIGYAVALCLLAFTVGCGGVTSTGTLAYVSNSDGTGFSVYTVNTDGTLSTASISPQSSPTPAGDGPKVIQFSANGKWAYYLDNAGTTIYAYTRAGDGKLATQIGTYSVSGGTSSYGASSLVIHPNSMFLYLALPFYQGGAIAVWSIDSSTGIPTQVGSNIQLGYPISQLVMNTSGSAIFGLSPGSNVSTGIPTITISGKQAVLYWSVNASSGQLTGPVATAVGVNPNYMVLSANGSYMYVLDNTATTLINPSVVIKNTDGTTSTVSCSTLTATSIGYTGCYSPNIYGFNVSTSATTPLSPMAGTSAGGGNVFNENADLGTGIFPANPIGGATSGDSRFLFVANQGSHNVSVFKINSMTGEPTEVLGSLTTVNGISTSSASPFDCGSGCSTPSFVAASKANNALYLLDTNAGRIFQFAINENTGQIRALSPASVGAETATSHPTWLTIR